MLVFSNIYCPLKLKYAYIYFYFNPFSVCPRFSLLTVYHYTSMHTHIYVHMIQMRAQSKRLYIMQIHFAEIKVLQQQNLLNVHHIPTLVCEVF